jgi:hypothetical protein
VGPAVAEVVLVPEPVAGLDQHLVESDRAFIDADRPVLDREPQ